MHPQARSYFCFRIQEIISTRLTIRNQRRSFVPLTKCSSQPKLVLAPRLLSGWATQAGPGHLAGMSIVRGIAVQLGGGGRRRKKACRSQHLCQEGSRSSLPPPPPQLSLWEAKCLSLPVQGRRGLPSGLLPPSFLPPRPPRLLPATVTTSLSLRLSMHACSLALALPASSAPRAAPRSGFFLGGGLAGCYWKLSSSSGGGLGGLAWGPLLGCPAERRGGRSLSSGNKQPLASLA